ANLALAMAGGSTVKAWADAHGVADRTARTWSNSQEVRDQVEAIRREIVHCTIGRLCNHATAAADEIARLASEATSEAVRLGAARADGRLQLRRPRGPHGRRRAEDRPCPTSVAWPDDSPGRRRPSGRSRRPSPTAPPGIGSPTPAPAGCPPVSASSTPALGL